jgi:hypothetical protein
MGAASGVDLLRRRQLRRPWPGALLSSHIRPPKDIKLSIRSGQHPDLTPSLIDWAQTTCQGNFLTTFYSRPFSKTSKKFDLNSLGIGPFQAIKKSSIKQHVALAN